MNFHAIWLNVIGGNVGSIGKQCGMGMCKEGEEGEEEEAWEEIFPETAFDHSDFSLWFCRGQSTGTYGLHHSEMSQDWHFIHIVH